MRKNISIPLLGFFLLVPFTLHSTDIYHSSEGRVRIHANLNQHIIPADPKLGNTILVVSAPSDMENIRLVTACEHRESVLYKKVANGRNIYVIQASFPALCDSSNISVGDAEGVFTDASISLPMESISKKESILINSSDYELLGIMRKEMPPATNTGTTIEAKLGYLQALYKNLNVALESDIARDILQNRDGRYASPVSGYGLPSKEILIPGAGRPYRRDTTDGIHHGWDIMAPFGTPVQALSKGKIIRIKNGWSWAELDTIKKDNLSEDDRLRNLDIFRGNQIWIQTMDGNVTFYSHLSKISPDIAIGTDVEKGTYIGNIGTSGVPEKNYKNIHLHFEIQKNPFREDMKDPSYLDIMRWDYVGENMKKAGIYEKMGEIFE